MGFGNYGTFGQSDKVTLEFSLSPILEQAQVLGLSSLGIDTEGGGPEVSGSLVNNTTGSRIFISNSLAASYGCLPGFVNKQHIRFL